MLKNQPGLVRVAALSGGGAGVVALDGGVHSSAALTAAGAVLTFGRGDSGQLGRFARGLCEADPKAGFWRATPGAVDLGGARAVQLACGSNHVLAVVDGAAAAGTGGGGGGGRALYSWGYGDMCQLGNGEEHDEHFPFRVGGGAAKGGAAPVWASGGGQHSVAVFEAP